MAFEDFKKNIAKAGGKGGSGDLVIQATVDTGDSKQQLSELDNALLGKNKIPGAAGAVVAAAKQEAKKAAEEAVYAAPPPKRRGFRGWVAGLKNRGHIAFGSEGLRVGHVRLSRSGLSLSEKTFLESQKLAATATIGQLVGTVGKEVVDLRDQLQKTDAVAGHLLKFPFKAGLRLGERTAALFGLQKVAVAGIALISGSSWRDAQKAWDDTVRTLMGEHEAIMREEREATLAIRAEAIQTYLTNQQKLKSKRLEQFPQDAVAQADAIREDIGRSFNEDRIMTRDLAGRPLWKVAMIPNEGN